MPTNSYPKLLNRKSVQAVDEYLVGLILKHVVLACIVGGLIFVFVALSFLGVVDFQIFSIAAAFSVCLQILICWSLSILYKAQRDLRFWAAMGRHVILVALTIITIQFSPLLPPPRFFA